MKTINQITRLEVLELQENLDFRNNIFCLRIMCDTVNCKECKFFDLEEESYAKHRLYHKRFKK